MPPRRTVLFLQDLGVERREVRRLLRRRLPGRTPSFPGDAEPRPRTVEAIVTADASVGRALLGLYSRARVVSVAFTGTDRVDLDACRERGVAVYAVPGYATDSTAEMALALTLAVLRDLPRADAAVRDGDWNEDLVGEELAGKTVGIVGTGRIGVRAAELYRAFRCRVVGWSRPRSRSRVFLRFGRYVPWETLFRDADVVSLHLPLSAATRGLVGRRELSSMRRGAVLVNTARGALVDAKALRAALRAGRIRAGLDVHETEPLPVASPLRRLPNAVLAPHLGYRTREALARRVEVALENVARALRGDPENRVVPR